MSHNTIQVNNIQVNNNNVPLSLASMTSTPSVNSVVKYDGSNFVASDSPSSKPYDLKVSNHQQSAGYSVPTSNIYTIGEYIIFRGGTSVSSFLMYRDTGFDRNNSTTTNSLANTTKWTESHDIPSAGTYLVTSTGTCRNSGANVTYQLESNSGAISSKIYVQEGSWYGSLAAGIITTTGSDVVRLVVKAQSTNTVLADDDDSWFFTFNILKLN